MRFAEILPLYLIVSCLLGLVCCTTRPAELTADEVNIQLKAIQLECDHGRIRKSMNRIALLKDSVDRLSTNEVLKQRVALVQADIQNMYTLCFATAFDTAKRYVEQLTAHAVRLPDSLKAAIGTTTGFHLYLAALLKGEPTMDSALSLFNSSNKMYAALKDTAGVALTSFYIGLCYENNTDSTKNNLVAAEDHYVKAMGLAAQARNPRTHSYATRHLAGLSFDRHNIDNALFFAHQSYAYREHAGWFVLRPFTCSLLGDIYRAANLDSAKKFHTLALAYAREYGFPGAIANNERAVAADDSLINAKQIK